MVSSLQLSDGTVVVLDETRLEPGKVGAEGVGNLSALNSLASLQKMPYDFGFYKMDFEVDHPTISVSIRGSVVPTGAVVPVIAVAADADGAASSAVSPVSLEDGEGEGVVLERLRVFVEATRRTELSLDEASSALAEEDFVKARQQGQAVTVRAGLFCCLCRKLCGLLSPAVNVSTRQKRFDTGEILDFSCCRTRLCRGPIFPSRGVRRTRKFPRGIGFECIVFTWRSQGAQAILLRVLVFLR